VSRDAQQISELEEEAMTVFSALMDGVVTDDDAECDTVMHFLNENDEALHKMEQEKEVLRHYQDLLNLPAHEFKNLESASALFGKRYEVWHKMSEWEAMIEEWIESSWHDLKPEELDLEVQARMKDATRLFKIDEDAVCARLKKSISRWKVLMPTLMALGNKALKERHWKQIFEELEQPFQASFLLSDLWSWDVFGKKERMEEISGAASGEYALELQLTKIEDSWNELAFVVKNYRETKDVYILGGLDDVTAQLEDNQALLQTMLASRFVAGIRQQVEEWDKKLRLVAEALDEWLGVQRAWMYLESIFGAPDIQKQLPLETVHFLRVDQQYKDKMRKTKKRPGVLECCAAEGVLEMFQEANKVLEKIQKSLEDYLETKRNGFPRFYFLSNDELLEILSQTRDPKAVQPHLRKCFDAMAAADFEEGPPLEGTTHPSTTLVGMNSAEKEKVRFSAPVATAPKSVEFWMCDLEFMMRQSLLDWTIEARRAYSDEHREKWFFEYPAASISTIDQEVWTMLATAAIDSIGSGTNAQGLEDFLEYSIKQIEKMVGVIRQDLTNIQRSVMANLIVIDVHARDVTKRLIRDAVSSLTDFAWICQLRYYWDEESIDDQHGVVVRQTNAIFYYGWEYLGVVPRLVITPLTDKCFVTLTGALNLLLGGAPAGPAGTGKTESVKDLGKALAMPVVVFNCSDGLDYKMMEKFFSGLAQAGAWACFDEFNRIDIEVLSVIAQQIMTICDALKANKDRFDFFGKEIRLDRNYGCFITMNPGYAGRTELPDNLKALFRPMAMMVPDYGLIAEIMLFSEGFGDSLSLSRKQTAMYRLASEQV
jgi:dynein heavy chain